MGRTTLIIGASPKTERYANKAQKALTETGHQVLLYHPRGGVIDGMEVISDFSAIVEQVDTLTFYVRPEILETMAADLIALKPRRVIFNPGTEDPGLAREFARAGIEVVEACTLVMLKTQGF